MGYEYDVFISYKRNKLIKPWVTNFFLELFQTWLEEKLLGIGESRPRIFFDQRDIEPGSPWPNDLRRAVQTSKILVAVCSPSYFDSSWCKSEWESFVQREENLGMTGVDCLRIPIRHNDCENFLSEIQYSDFYGHTYLAREYYQSAQAIEFERKVEDLADIVARKIKYAPIFQPDWPAPIIQKSPSTNILIQRL